MKQLRERGVHWSGGVRLGEERQPAGLAYGSGMTFKAARARIISILMPGKSFLIAGALAWSGIVVAMVTVSREPVPAVSAPVAAKFEARWEDVSDEPPLLKKQDRLVVREQEPVPKHPDIVVVPPVKMPVVVALPNEDKPVSRRRVHRERNVCTKHNMRKVMTRGGRSWRCRR